MFDFLENLDYDLIVSKLLEYGLTILKVLIVLIIGIKLINILSNRLSKRLERSKIDPSLRSFVIPLISITLKVTLYISLIAMMGVEMTSFVALIGSIGLAIGLSLQGSLSNFAGGVLILLFKPFKVGDFIEVNSMSGTVKDISIFYTILSTPDNKKIVVPNSEASNSSLINYSTHPTRRMELKLSCHYNNDIHLVKEILFNLISQHELVLKDPIPVVYLAEYGNSSINFIVRGWVNSQDFWNVYYDLMFKVKGEFDKNGIVIPYPQMDVNFYNQNK